MHLVWHIVRKDLRHAGPYLAGALTVLVLNSWNYLRALSSHDFGIADMSQRPLDWLLFVSAALLYGVLLHGESVPGARQHWVARPMRWQTLLTAKLLLLPVFAIPVVLSHWLQLALRGFSLTEHGLAIFWNACWLVFTGLLPVAVLASLCRDLRQLTIWFLACAAGVVGMQVWNGSPPQELLWVVQDVAIVLGVAGCLGILVWQYATRRSRPARVAAVLLTIVLATLDRWPVALWRSLQHSGGEAVTALTLQAAESPMFTSWSTLHIPFQVDGLAPGLAIVPNEWKGTLTASSGETAAVRASGASSLLRKGELSVTAPPGFLSRHSNEPLNVELTAELTVFAAPQFTSLPVNGSGTVPGIGPCESWQDQVLVVQCQSVLGLAGRFLLQPAWPADETRLSRVFPLSRGGDQSPLLLQPRLHPIGRYRGAMGQDWTSPHAVFRLETRAPVAHVQRKLQLRDTRSKP